MRTIFTSILRGYFDIKDDASLSIQAEDLIISGVEIYQQSIISFLPTPSCCHYTFNLRDLSKVI
jgi:dynein heavy chain